MNLAAGEQGEQDLGLADRINVAREDVAVVRDPAKNTVITFESATKPRAGSDEQHVFAAN